MAKNRKKRKINFSQYTVKRNLICKLKEFVIEINNKKWRKEMKQKQRNNPEIVVPKGYELDEFIDTDDEGYGFDGEAIYREEVKVTYERD